MITSKQKPKLQTNKNSNTKINKSYINLIHGSHEHCKGVYITLSKSDDDTPLRIPFVSVVEDDFLKLL